MRKTERLRADIKTALKDWNESAPITISGTRGLTRGDISILLVCSDEYDEKGSLLHLHYLPPEVKEVLKNYKML
jgi:hypothetical protein